MTQDSTPTLAMVEAQIDILCRRVGLTRTDGLPGGPTEGNETIAPPDGTALWTSSYAHLLLWPAGGAVTPSLAASAEAGEAWFDAWLLSTERVSRGRTIDGYLVLALSGLPQGDDRDEVRRLELSAHICRKHIIWPTPASEDDGSAGTWSRLADITMLGLPEAAAPPTAELEWPELDADASALWTDLVSLGPSATLQQDEA